MARSSSWYRGFWRDSVPTTYHSREIAFADVGETITRTHLITYHLGGGLPTLLASATIIMGLYAWEGAGTDPEYDPRYDIGAPWLWWGVLQPEPYYSDPTQPSSAADCAEILRPPGGELDIKAQRGPAPQGGLYVQLVSVIGAPGVTYETYENTTSSVLILHAATA